MFSLIFAALFMGIVFARIYFVRALDRARADEELNLARRIQRSFLISQFPLMPRLEVHAINVSSRQVSGDFYDVVAAGENAFLIAIADVAGKGVPAALMSSMLQASLRTQAGNETSVAAILRNINSLVYRSTAVHQFATFFLARIEEDRMRLRYSNAGHNHPIVFRRDGERMPLERGGTVVGILESVEFEEDTVALQPGDRVLLYTDGISEAANARGEMFGEERLIETVSRMPSDLPARETVERILEAVRGFLDGTDAGDDMTLMVLRVLEPATRPSPEIAPAVPAA
jgi:sigma-B regulation protein RsbU (phosphoserine phosphatase)